MSGISLNVLLFLIRVIFDFYIIVLIIRLILAWAKADYSHPITQLVVRLTDCIIKPMRRFIPDVHGIELSTLVLIVIVSAIKFLLLFMLSFGFPNIFGLLIISIADTIELILVTLVFAIFIQWLVSLLQPESPINQLLNKLTWPIMRPLQRVIPRIGGLDWSWVPAMIALFLIIIIVVQPLKAIGLGIAIG